MLSRTDSRHAGDRSSNSAVEESGPAEKKTRPFRSNRSKEPRDSGESSLYDRVLLEEEKGIEGLERLSKSASPFFTTDGRRHYCGSL